MPPQTRSGPAVLNRTENTATALWIETPGKAALRQRALSPPSDTEVRVRALFSGISRGTERLVFEGRVPESEHDRMGCPFMAGAFPAPVSYGYMCVGRVEAGPADLEGREVFCLHPHQDRFTVPAQAVIPLPEGLPAERAILAANMETALNVLWDSRLSFGDRVAVIGAGVIGALTAALACAVPGTDVTLVDINPDREALAAGLGISFASPQAVPADCDVVVHCSATAPGLATALACAGPDARVVEASWHGSGLVGVPLGAAFHSRRLTLVGSQVGNLPPERRPRWSHRRRLAKALELLKPAPFEALVSGETRFAEIPQAYAAILNDPATLCHRIRYT
jgi:threonine dehydrogenase-like Zn-dependent dehydrogenase